MQQPRLRPIKDEPVMPMRKCGHPGGWTLDLLEARKDGTIIATSYCAGCIIDKLGLKPVAQHKIEGEKITKIWGD